MEEEEAHFVNCLMLCLQTVGGLGFAPEPGSS